MDGRHALVLGEWQDPERWSTGRVAPERQFDFWCEFVSHAHLTWSIPRQQRFDHFPAYLREGRYDGCRVTHLTSSRRVKGIRGSAEIARDREALYNLLYITEGSECLVMDGRDVVLSPGQFVLWDSTRPMIFLTGEQLRQVTLCIPHERLERVLPRAADYVGRVVTADHGLSRVFADHLLSLENQFGQLPCKDAPQVLDASIALLAATLDAAVPLEAGETARPLLQHVQARIERRLGEPHLCMAEIAADCGITVRHLHRLFEGTDSSAAAWIRRRRLEGCRRDLASPAHDRTSITTIAYRWGFADSSTFSKVFRREFGVSPREFRNHRGVPAG